MIGRTISHYKILEKLGEGGMGVVYKAEDTRLERTVALKFLSPHILQSEKQKARFLREAKAAAALDHPNICMIYEIDEADGQTFLAMAYVDGPTVKQKVQSRPLKLEEALDIAIQAAEGLQVAHQKGVVHRDIKGSNLMLTEQGQVKIMDFGLAQLSGQTKITETGTRLGTPAYMSPEQARGETVDERTDIWSLGVVLHEIISGQLPFRGEREQAVLYGILKEDPEPLTGLRTGVPIELDRVVGKTLAKSADERYQHVDELLVDLRVLRKQLEAGGPRRPPEEKAPVPAAEVSIGQMLEHYQLEAKLGEGGMGVVYRALDTHLDRPVAIKVLSARAVADPERKKRFVQEAKAASALNHPNIITIHDITTAQGVDFIAMEYVDGKTLEQLIARKGLGLGEALKYAIQITDALSTAHTAGIVHRDLKPANIMVTAQGLVKVLDFGLAKLTEPRGSEESGRGVGAGAEEAPKTEEGAILGTVAYMSPEQAEGKVVDARSDIFSFGSMLYEMLASRRAFSGETKMSVLAAILDKEPQPLSEAAAGIPRELERIITRCLRKDRARRFQHMDDLKIALEELKEESDSGKLISALPSAARPARRWAMPMAIALGVLGVVLTVGVTLWLTRSREPAPDLAPQSILTRLTSDTGLTYQPALSPDGKLLAYASDRAGEGNLDIWMQQVAGGEPIRLTRHEADDSEPAFSPDGSKLAFRSAREGGGIYVMSALGGDARLIAKEGRRPRFSPDGKWIAYWVGSEHLPRGGVYVVASTGGPPRELQQGRSPVWSPDGNHLLFLERSWESDWSVTSSDGGEAVKTGALEVFRRQALSPEVEGRSAVFFIPEIWPAEGDYVVFSARLGDSTNLWKLPISPKTWKVAGPAERLTSGTGSERQASLTAGGRLVFSSLIQNSDIWSLPIDSNRGKVVGEIQRLTANAAADTHPFLSADGKKLVFRSQRSGNWDIWMKDLESRKETALTTTPVDERWPIITADGSEVAYTVSPRSVYIVPASGGVAEKVCNECGHPADWSSHGENILHNPDGGMALLNVISGEKTDLLESEPGGVVLRALDARFSPDDRWIAFHQLKRYPDRRQLFITPFRSGVVGDENEWVAITDGSGSGMRVAWSPDGNRLYFLSDRDGFRCIWGQRLDPATKRPVGSPLDIYHFHEIRRSLMNVSPGLIGLSVARDKVAFAMQELTGNIWMMQPQAQE
ncbi:serine/threonine-protein kinase [Acidobacteria bacterium AH-259-A15]|nr:serine/threonine-protein kinase [Acidobacteria bacterium AH-259-A15]